MSPRFDTSPGSPGTGKRRRVSPDPELLREKSLRRKQRERIEELEAELANKQTKAAEAPLSVYALENDAHVRSAVRQYTGFYSIRSFKAYLSLMNGNGRMETVNPSHCQHPALGHDQHLYTVEDDPVRPGVWCETTWELDPVQDEPNLLKIAADELVQVINPPTDEAGGPSPGDDYVWVQTADGTARGKVPSGALTPLSDAEAGAAHSYQRVTGRKRALSWENAIFFVL